MHVLGQEAPLDLIGRWLVAEHGVVLEGVRPIVGGSMGEQSEWHLIAVPVEAVVTTLLHRLAALALRVVAAERGRRARCEVHEPDVAILCARVS
jgi:hypothetical protein